MIARIVIAFWAVMFMETVQGFHRELKPPRFPTNQYSGEHLLNLAGHGDNAERAIKHWQEHHDDVWNDTYMKDTMDGQLRLLPTMITSRRDDIKAVLKSSEANPKWGGWGSYGPWEYCLPGYYAFGAKLKFEKRNLFNDNTMANGIQLYCQYSEFKYFHQFTTMTSTVGPYGKWLGWVAVCPQDLIGFRLKVQRPQGEGDDTSTNDIELRCKGNFDDIGKDTTRLARFKHNSEYPTDGEWHDEMICPVSSYICGIQTQIEGPRGDGDDSGLNNVNMACCGY